MDAINDFIIQAAASPWLLLVMFAVALIDGFFPPVPSETVLVAAAAVAISAGDLPTVLLLGLVAAVGATIGDNIAYAIGRSVGVTRFRWMRGPRTIAALDRARQALRHRGTPLILGARYIPVGRVAVNMSAGALRYPWRRFLPISAVAGVMWAVYSAGIGALAGQWLRHQPLLSAVLGVAFALVIGLMVDRIAAVRRRRREIRPTASRTSRRRRSVRPQRRAARIGQTGGMTGTRSRRPSRRTLLIVALATVAVVLFSVLVPIHAAALGTVLPVAMLLGAGLCGAPLLSLVRPRTAIAMFCLAAFTLPLVVSGDRDPAWPWPWSVPALLAFAVFVAVVTLAHGWRTGLIPVVASVAGSLVAPLVLPDAATPGAAGADLIVTASIVGVAFLVAVLLAGRIRVGAELHEERQLTAREQSRRMLVEERTRIARELHDVVAHTMSLVQVQASTARYRLPGLSEAAVDEFDDIAAVARGSLTEMRRLLGVLRTDDQEPQLAPQQDLADLPELIDGIRRAGVDIRFAEEPSTPVPPASVQITAFRIVQEALSNAVRHAPGARVAVELGTRVDGPAPALTVRVHNTAGDAPSAAQSGAGHGLRGMQERVALVAGTLLVGPDPAGGWTVAATLPWTEDPTVEREERP